MRRLTLLLILVTLTACGGAPNAGGEGGGNNSVIAAFKAAGLEVANEREMTKDDYGQAPVLCSGTQFAIPSLGADIPNNVFVCATREELTSLKTYYNVRGQGNPELRSWTFSKGTVLVRIDGKLPADQAKKYEAAIPAE
jgi:hypothetical protein